MVDVLGLSCLLIFYRVPIYAMVAAPPDVPGTVMATARTNRQGAIKKTEITRSILVACAVELTSQNALPNNSLSDFS